jgi:hypothetical protein
MTKEQALQEISNHMDILIDYEIVSQEVAQVLFMYITDSVDKIENKIEITQEGLDTLAVWRSIKNNNNDYGDEFKNPS